MTSSDEAGDDLVENLFREVDDQFKDLEREYSQAREDLAITDVSATAADPLEASNSRFELMSQVASLEAQISRQADQLDDRDRMIAELGDRISGFEARLAAGDQTVDDLHLAKQEVLEERREQARLAALLEARAAERQELVEVAHRLQNERDHVQELLTLAIARFDEVETTRLDLDDKLRHLQAAQDTASKEHDARAHELIETRAGMGRLADRLDELKNSADDANERAEKAEALAERRANEAGYLNRRIDAMSEKVDSNDLLNEQLESLRKDNARLEGQVSNLDRDLVAQRAEATAAAAAVEAIAQRSSEHEELLSRISVLEEQRDEAWRAASGSAPLVAPVMAAPTVERVAPAEQTDDLVDRAREMAAERANEDPGDLPPPPLPPPPAAPVSSPPLPPPPAAPVSPSPLPPPSAAPVAAVAAVAPPPRGFTPPSAAPATAGAPPPRGFTPPPTTRSAAPPSPAAPSPATLPAVPRLEERASVLPPPTDETPRITPPAIAAPAITSAAIAPSEIAEQSEISAPPSVSRPPDIEVLALEVPSFKVSEGAAADVEIPQLGVPQVDVADVDIPQLEVPQVAAPQLSVPQVDVPAVGVPQVGVPEVDAPQLTAPQIAAPQGAAIAAAAAQAEAAAELATLPAPPAAPALEIDDSDIDVPQFEMQPAAVTGAAAASHTVRKRTILPADLAPNTPEAVAHLLNQPGVTAIIDARSTCGRTGIRPSELFERVAALRDHFDLPIEVVVTPVSTPVGGAPDLLAVGVHHVTGADTVSDRVRALCMGLPSDQPLVVIAGDDHVRRAAIGEEANVVEPTAVLNVLAD